MKMAKSRSPRDRRGSPGVSQAECARCGNTGVHALPLSEGHGEVRFGCPRCRAVWTIPERRRQRRRAGDRRDWDLTVRPLPKPE